MLRRIGLALLWVAGLVLVFVCSNLNDPYLLPMRGWRGSAILLAGSLAGLALLLFIGMWRGRLAGKLLVLLWCMPPLAMASAEILFQTRKQAVLGADHDSATTLGRHFVVGYKSFDEVSTLAAKGLIAGVYITRHNFKERSAEALKAELAQLQAIRARANLPPLIVAADQEGGIVSHLSPQLTRLPALAGLAALSSAQRSSKAEEFGRLHGEELAALGVTLNFAPVVDLLPAGTNNRFDFNSLIDRRAISSDPAIVTDIASSYIRGLEASGVDATIKHFPGLGRVNADTHHFSASLDTPLPELESSDWIPFRDVLKATNAAVMVGHVAVSAIDAERPASHSKRVINDLLRERWGFQRIVITDDLVMGAVYQHGVCKAVVEALNGGADLLLVAYDGLQYYRMFNCALNAYSRSELDADMLRKSDQRLRSWSPNGKAKPAS